MSQTNESTDIWIFWLHEPTNDVITFIPTAHYHGGRTLTTLLLIEDKYSTVRMQENSLINIQDWNWRLPLGVFRGGRGSIKEVHKILTDCVEEYDPADEQFWYQRFYEDLIDDNGRYLHAHGVDKYAMDMKSLAAMMLLFGHTQLPEKYRNPEGLGQPGREEYPRASGYGCKCGWDYYGAYTAYTQYARYTQFQPQPQHYQQQQHHTYTYQPSQAPPQPQQYTYPFRPAPSQAQAQPQAQAQVSAREAEPRVKQSSSKHKSKSSCSSHGPPPMTKEAERAFRKYNEQSKKPRKLFGWPLSFV
ncbi:hypothetical protein BJY00DRAFT_314150 [Aspergillus carlsbadensis]|nr:hypothetical protein BJY00DRAFT_314150 [Aspergillus carlsbadensis]